MTILKRVMAPLIFAVLIAGVALTMAAGKFLESILSLEG